MIEIEVPKDVNVDISGNAITIKGPLGTNTRMLNDTLLTISKKDGKLVIEQVAKGKLFKKAAMAEVSFAKVLKNDIVGVAKHYEINMRIVFAHFPINIEIKGAKLNINNMIGERVPRISKIVGTTKIEVKGQAVRLYGTSLDDVSQTAANIRLACKIRNKDSRVFQDGLYYEIE
ncbi:MAG TPA: 50S ribosomal protein L6 [Candidatus Acidoferrales bacterium]|nr:50S ribosomal protein L6 [Candidatus Acidoferrales bacterium]